MERRARRLPACRRCSRPCRNPRWRLSPPWSSLPATSPPRFPPRGRPASAKRRLWRGGDGNTEEAVSFGGINITQTDEGGVERNAVIAGAAQTVIQHHLSILGAAEDPSSALVPFRRGSVRRQPGRPAPKGSHRRRQSLDREWNVPHRPLTPEQAPGLPSTAATLAVSYERNLTSLGAISRAQPGQDRPATESDEWLAESPSCGLTPGRIGALFVCLASGSFEQANPASNGTPAGMPGEGRQDHESLSRIFVPLCFRAFPSSCRASVAGDGCPGRAGWRLCLRWICPSWLCSGPSFWSLCVGRCCFFGVRGFGGFGRRMEERYAIEIINHAAEGIVTLNKCGMVTSLNPAAEKLFGYRSSEARNRPVTDLLAEPPEDHKNCPVRQRTGRHDPWAGGRRPGNDREAQER